MKKKILTGLTIGLFVFGMVSYASATRIISAQSATTNMGEYISSISPIEKLIDQSGLSSTYISGTNDFDVYVGSATHTSAAGNDWIASTGNTTGIISFDLGSILTISKIAIWNMSMNNPNRMDSGVSNINILASQQSNLYSAPQGKSFPN